MNGNAAVSLGKIIRAAEAGELGARDGLLGGCVYEDQDGKHCAIGCLLDKGTLDDIRRNDIMHVTANILFNRFPSVAEMTGFTKEQAEAIQNWHDTCYAGMHDFTPELFIQKMKELVAYKATELRMNPLDEEDEEEEWQPEMVSFAN